MAISSAEVTAIEKQRTLPRISFLRASHKAAGVNTARREIVPAPEPENTQTPLVTLQ